MGTTHSKNAISGTRETVDPKFLEAMERLREYKPQPPEGAFTVEQAAAEWGYTDNSRASKKLRQMWQDGILERMNVENNKMYYWFKE